MRVLLIAVGLLVLAGCGAEEQTGSDLLIASAEVTTTVPTTPSLPPNGKAALDQAAREGRAAVVLVLSTEHDAADRVGKAITDLGGTVEAADARIGYLRVSVPVGLVKQVLTVPGVRQVDVDEPLSNADPTP
ncbi:hypothetical protein [Actinosynnema sp. NPDC020468]|uniref:hypothetical protein n=1 Tax=Actinosynnema sp. NPDC020468 TaxID=3154488 RepID=UPI0033CC2634